MATFTTYEAIGQREELMDVIYNISPTDTPLLNKLKKTTINSRKPEWLTDTLKAASAAGTVEGADASYKTVGTRTRLSNYTHIFSNAFMVSNTEDIVSKAGMDKEYAYQLGIALKEIANDMEYALWTSTVSSGTSGAARTMDGVLAWITTNVETGSGTGSEALTEDMYNDLLQTVYAAGGNPDVTYCAGGQKRVISSFTAGSTKNVNAVDGRLVNSVDVYDSDFGRQEIVLDRYVTASVVACLQQDMWEFATLRPAKATELAPTGDARKCQVVAEVSLIAKNEKASGQITQLS